MESRMGDEEESGEETPLNWGGLHMLAQWKDSKPMYMEVGIYRRPECEDGVEHRIRSLSHTISTISGEVRTSANGENTGTAVQ